MRLAPFLQGIHRPVACVSVRPIRHGSISLAIIGLSYLSPHNRAQRPAWSVPSAGSPDIRKPLPRNALLCVGSSKLEGERGLNNGTATTGGLHEPPGSGGSRLPAPSHHFS